MDGEHRTVAVIAGQDRRTNGEVLELLERCLADGDTVFVAAPDVPPAQNGFSRRGGTGGPWRVQIDGRLVSAPPPRALAPVVVLVDGRSTPIGSWLAPLQRALADRTVGCAAPRTNAAGGDELLVGVPYRPDEGDAHRSFVEERAGDPTVTDVSVLDGPCVAVRRSDFEAIGGPGLLAGPSPVAEVARRIAARGRRVVVAEGSYLHTGGGPDPRLAAPETPAGAPERLGGAPLVSACLIVKNERENLPRCLASLEGFCDEVVVYDTGSSDRSSDLARARGATVVEGYWDGDFSRARNAALEHCRGQWVLWIDADEELRCGDRAEARRNLAALPTSAEALIVLIDNVRGTRASTSVAHSACRLFRRACGHWTGRIHEQVLARAGSPDLRTMLAQDVRITHWGYLRTTVERRAKGDRNVRSALADLAGVAELPWAARLMSLARSYGLKGQPEEAADLCRAALATATEPHLRRLAGRTLADTLLALGDPQGALAEVAALRRAGAEQGDGSRAAALAITEGRAHLALGRPDRALAAFDQVAAGLDVDGFDTRPDGLAADRARALGQLGRFAEAADTLLAGIRASGGMDAPVGMLLECLEKSGRTAHDVATAVPPERQVAFLGQLVTTEPGLADRALESWYEVAPSLPVLATAATVAPSLPLPRRIVWSARLREQGVARACPLIATVADVARPVPERLLAAALAVEMWGDPRARQAVTALVAMVPEAERPEVLSQVAAVAPSVDPSVRGVAPTSGPLGGPTPPAAGHAVLVVDRQPASLRSMALAVAMRRAGHRVTVSWPAPAPATERRLAACGIDTRTWHGPAGDWQEACSGDAAHAAAGTHYDAVVLSPSVHEMAGTVRALMPESVLVADLDDGAAGGAVAPWAELMLTAAVPPAGDAPDPATAPAVAVPASAGELFGPAPATPWELRHGAVVVGDFAAAEPDELERWRRTLAPMLDRQLAGHPVALLGCDPEGTVQTAIPRALALGPAADPLSWLRAARVAVVATRAGARHWRAAAALAGTPVLSVPPASPGETAPSAALADLVAAAAALASSEAPVPQPAAMPDAVVSAAPAGDPLATLAPPHGRPPSTGSAGTPASPSAAGVRVAWSRESASRHRLRALGPDGRPVAGQPDGAILEIRGGAVPDLSPRRALRVAVELQWGYAGLPVEWIGPLRDVADEVWVPGEWLAGVLQASGIPDGVVHVVRPGVDIVRFAPERPPYELRTDRSLRFLYVGDCDEASGADALLEAYLTAFSDHDDVCLVVRPTGPVERRTFEADLRRAGAGAPGRPAVEVVDPDLTAGDVAGLYRACDVLVQPHRASGSLNVVLEAMASGRPVVALAEGATSDICDGRTGWVVPCRRVRATPPQGLLVAGDLHHYEPRRAALAEALRDAAGSADGRLLKGLVARDRVVTSYSHDAAVAAVAARIGALCAASVAAAARSGSQDGEPPPAAPAAG